MDPGGFANGVVDMRDLAWSVRGGLGREANGMGEVWVLGKLVWTTGAKVTSFWS